MPQPLENVSVGGRSALPVQRDDQEQRATPARASKTTREQALFELGHALRAQGYHFVTPTPATHRRVNARAARRGEERARDLRDVFGFSRPFEAKLLPAPLFALLEAAGELERSAGLCRARVRFSSLADLLLVHSGHPTSERDAVFFGPDTYRFCSLLKRWAPHAARLVDVGCGSGAGGLSLRGRATEIVLSDVNERALAYARVNARLAGVDAQVRRSDVLNELPGAPDLVIANPPYMLDPSGRQYRDGGGAHGEGLSLRIVREACARLAPGGTLILYTGSACVDGRDTFLSEVAPVLDAAGLAFEYEELDPDVFGEELSQPGYERVERIAAVGLRVRCDSQAATARLVDTDLQAQAPGNPGCRGWRGACSLAPYMVTAHARSLEALSATPPIPIAHDVPHDQEALHRALALSNRTRLVPSHGSRDFRYELRAEYAFRSLEGELLEQLQSELRAQLSEVPRTADAFVAWFEQLEQTGPGQGDPLFPWLRDRATLEQMRWFLRQEMAGEAGFDDLVALTQVRIPDRAKLELARNYWDEMGQGHAGGMHGPLLRRLGEELRIEGPDDNSDIVWESLALGNVMIALAMNRHLAYQSIGALGVIELTAPGRAEHVNAGLKRLGVDGAARRYYALHATLDRKHSAAWNSEVLRPLVASDPGCAEAIAEGALLRLQAGARCFERYRRELGLKPHALTALPQGK
jgi:methylase of polypeptide subunit release factors